MSGLAVLAMTSLVIGAPTGHASDTPPIDNNSEEVILLLGDSISAAYGMDLEQGWAALLNDRIDDSGLPFNVVNASISGETVAGALRRLPNLLSRHQPKHVIIELGVNDGLRGYPIAQLQDNLRQLVELSQSAGARVLLLPMEIPPNFGPRYTSAFRDSFTRIATETGAAKGRFMLEEVATRPSLMQGDGIHPNVAAQPLILDTLWPDILRLLEDSTASRPENPGS